MDWKRERDILMAHFAELNENHIVQRVIVVNNNELLIDGIENENKGIEFCVAHFGGTWIQTSIHANFRGQFAAIGMKYNRETDVFEVIA
jgi:hypothetical protein